jgi:broad specificity phosphatase PhoE
VSETAIILVRHGETDWNRDRRVQGHTDVPLNDAGRLQAELLAAVLAEEQVDVVYSSDLERALETASIVAGPRSLTVTPHAALREKHFGTWEGLTDTEVLGRFPDAAHGHWGDGETTEEMADRVLAAVLEIGAAHPGQAVVVVTHGGPMRALLRHCELEDGPIVNCHVVRLVARDGVLRRVD